MNDYDTDFEAWTQEQAQALRERDLTALDWDHLAEEIERLGLRDQRAAPEGTRERGGARMASSREQELAKELVVAWLQYMAAVQVSPSTLTEATSAATTVARMYQVIVKAIEETSPPTTPESPSI